MSTHLRQQVTQAALVDLYDESHGVFAQLIEPQVALTALSFEDNVGKIDDPANAKAVTALHSLPCVDKTEIVVEVDNTTRHSIRIRWMDEKGHNPESQMWTLLPGQTTVQCARPGYLYLVSVIMVDQTECLLGAYRTLKALPSGSPHYVLVEEKSVEESTSSFFLETILTDETGQDALVVAAAALDPVGRGGTSSQKTLATLSMIVHNVLEHPNDNKYQRLRLSNTRVQHHIVSNPGALYFLHQLGFRETENDVELAIAKPPPRLELFRRAADLLTLLTARAEPTFVAELATPAPWQPPVLTTGHPTPFHTSGTHFITPEERWARTERWSAWRRHGLGGH